MTRQQIVEQFRDVWRHGRTLTREALTERESMIVVDVMGSAAQFASIAKEKQLTPTKLRDYERTALHLDGMLNRIETAVEGRAA